MCADCFAKIRYSESMEPVSGELDGMISAVVYNGVVKKLIRQFKYKPYVSKLSEIISEIMNEGLAQNESFYNFVSKYNPTIIPIPLSNRRLRERGYNHAEIIATHVAKYFNLKHKRIGPLFQSMFKAVRIETDDQLLHVSRYIHLNPSTSYIVDIEKLSAFHWSSFPEYLGERSSLFVNYEIILSLVGGKQKYKDFIFDQAEYQRELDKIKHLTLE